MIPFAAATWEEYHTGIMDLPIVNGPSEGLLAVQLLYLTVAAVGRGAVMEPSALFAGTPAAGWSLFEIATAMNIVVIAGTAILSAVNVFRCVMAPEPPRVTGVVASAAVVDERSSSAVVRRRSAASGASGAQPSPAAAQPVAMARPRPHSSPLRSVLEFAPFALNTALFHLWAHIDPAAIASAPWLFLTAYGVIFAKYAGRMIVARVCSRRLSPGEPSLLVALAAVVHAWYGCPVVDSATAVWLVAAYAVSVYAMATVAVITDFTTYLGIKCFSIPH
jgi:hypothetical protein